MSFYKGSNDHQFKIGDLSVPQVYDNLLELSGASNIEFQEIDHSILEGQPYEGVSTDGPTIRIKAGAKSSPDAAAEFLKFVDDDGDADVNMEDEGPDKHILCIKKGVEGKPQELNFA